jgi:mRNA-degrading endonuclease RelE of RelBE toxin-antitoxin system
MENPDLPIIFTEKAYKDLKKMDKHTRGIFKKHIQKILESPTEKHLRNGLNYFVENVGQGRIPFEINLEKKHVLIVRCFTTHEEYDEWLEAQK